MKRSIIATILAATVLVSMAGMVSADDRWYLHNDDQMYHQNPGAAGTNVSIDAGNSNVWRTNDTTGNTCFTGLSLTMLDINSVDCNVSIGYCDTGGNNFVRQAYMIEWCPDSNIYDTFDNVTVPTGKYLAINVTNTGNDDALIVYTTTGSVLLHKGATYPTPELATFAFVGIGLIGLVALGRRRT